MSFDPITAGLEVASKVIDRIFPDKAKADEAKLAMAQLQMSGELKLILGQIEVNKAEATNTNLFVAGWRPFIGWVCGLALAYQYIGRPLLVIVGNAIDVAIPVLPLDGTLWELMFGMLGIGGLRTFEKLKGKA